MRRTLAGLAVVALLLAPVTGARGSSKELQIIETKLTGTTLTVLVENTTGDLVDGRLLGFFNNGNGTHPDQEAFEKIEPGVHEYILEFPSGSVAPIAVVDDPDPTGVIVLPGHIILGTITDDITPF